MKEVVILAGTNLGAKRENLSRALRMMTEELGEPVRTSPVYQTTAGGFDAPDFFNQLLVFPLNENIDPYTLLSLLQEIERKMGRKEKTVNKQYHSRIIDLDILYYGDWILISPGLRIPHPQILERAFAGQMLADMMPAFVPPGQSHSIRYLVEHRSGNMESGGEIVRKFD